MKLFYILFILLTLTACDTLEKKPADSPDEQDENPPSEEVTLLENEDFREISSARIGDESGLLPPLKASISGKKWKYRLKQTDSSGDVTYKNSQYYGYYLVDLNPGMTSFLFKVKNCEGDLRFGVSETTNLFNDELELIDPENKIYSIVVQSDDSFTPGIEGKASISLRCQGIKTTAEGDEYEEELLTPLIFEIDVVESIDLLAKQHSAWKFRKHKQASTKSVALDEKYIPAVKDWWILKNKHAVSIQEVQSIDSSSDTFSITKYNFSLAINDELQPPTSTGVMIVKQCKKETCKSGKVTLVKDQVILAKKPYATDLKSAVIEIYR